MKQKLTIDVGTTRREAMGNITYSVFVVIGTLTAAVTTPLMAYTPVMFPVPATDVYPFWVCTFFVIGLEGCSLVALWVVARTIAANRQAFKQLRASQTSAA